MLANVKHRGGMRLDRKKIASQDMYKTTVAAAAVTGFFNCLQKVANGTLTIPRHNSTEPDWINIITKTKNNSLPPPYRGNRTK
jgi:hypothetical protein